MTKLAFIGLGTMGYPGRTGYRCRDGRRFAGAAQSWQMENRNRTMIAGEYDFGFAVDWMRKDLGYTLNEARRNGSHLPVTALIDQFYSKAWTLGHFQPARSNGKFTQGQRIA